MRLRAACIPSLPAACLGRSCNARAQPRIGCCAPQAVSSDLISKLLMGDSASSEPGAAVGPLAGAAAAAGGPGSVGGDESMLCSSAECSPAPTPQRPCLTPSGGPKASGGLLASALKSRLPRQMPLHLEHLAQPTSPSDPQVGHCRGRCGSGARRAGTLDAGPLFACALPAQALPRGFPAAWLPCLWLPSTAGRAEAETVCFSRPPPQPPSPTQPTQPAAALLPAASPAALCAAAGGHRSAQGDPHADDDSQGRGRGGGDGRGRAHPRPPARPAAAPARRRPRQRRQPAGAHRLPPEAHGQLD